MFTPVTCGCVAGCVNPAPINTEDGVIVTFDESAVVSVTVTPPMGAAVAKVTANGTDCPGDSTTLDGRPMIPPLAAGVLVSEKFTGVTLPTLAATLYGPPGVAFALTMAEACPAESVDTVTAEAVLAPLLGPVNVTATLATGLLELSRTKATNGALNAVPTAVLWPLPDTSEMAAGVAAMLLKEKAAVAASPATEADTW